MMSLRNYENARNHWRHWASKLKDDEQKSYALFEPKHSTFLKKQCALLGNSLHGLMVQQEAAKQYRRDVTQAQQRDVINAEKGYYLWQDKHVESMANKHYQEKSSIQKVTGSYVFESYRLLKDEKINEEIQRLEAEQKKEESNKKANHEAVVAAIKKEIEELNAFLAQLPKMREAIEEFAEQQIQDELSAQSIARAQREHRTLGSAKGEPGAVNDGYALTEKQRKEKQLQIVEIPIRWGRGSVNVPLTVKESYDAEGNPEIAFEISAKYIKKHRWGFRGVDQLNGAGRRALLAEMHDRMSKRNILAFGLDFEKIDSDDYEWYVKFLTTSLMLSNEHAKKQLGLSEDPTTPFSSDIITHDATIASMMKLMEKEHSINRSLNGLFGGEALAVKRLNNDNCTIKTQLIVQETTYIRDGVQSRGSNTGLMAATNAAVASERLARAARNHIALALDKINLGGGGVAKAAEALGLLNIAEESAEAAYKNARTLASQARVELGRQLAALRLGARKPTELRELEVLVVKADDRVKELAAAVAKIKSVRNSFHDAFDASTFTADQKAALPRALGDKDAVFRALAPVIAADTASLAEIAKILYAARQAFNPAVGWNNVAAAQAAFTRADPAGKLAMLQGAFSFNAAGTMAVLRAAHAKVAGHAPATVMFSALEREFRSIVDAHPEDFAEIARQNDAQRLAIVAASPESFAAIARTNAAQRRAIVAASPASFAAIARANDAQRRAIVAASPASFAAIARANDAQRRAIVEASPESFAAIARAHPDTLRTIVATSTESFVDIARNDRVTLQAIIKASPESFTEIVRNDPEALRAIIAASPESFADIIIANPEVVNMMLHILTGFDPNSELNGIEADEALQQARGEIEGNFGATITQVKNRLRQPGNTPVSADRFKTVPLAVSQELNRSGLAFERVREDGSCFYYAIATSIAGQQLSVEDQDAQNIALRGHVAEILLANRAQYEPLFGAMVAQARAEGKEDYNGLLFEQYVQGVRSGVGPMTSAWADNLTIGALAQHLDRPVHIIGPDGNSIASATENHPGEPLFVFYNGTNHYDAFVPEQGMARSEILSRLKFSQTLREAMSTATPEQINAGIARAAALENDTGIAVRELRLNAVTNAGENIAKAAISNAVETQNDAFDILYNKVQELAQAGDGADAAMVAAAAGADGNTVKDAMSAALGAADEDLANQAIVAAAGGADGDAVKDAMSEALRVHANADEARDAMVAAATVAGPTGDAVKNAMSVALREHAIAHPNDPAVQAVIKRVLAIANPDAVAANSAIDALAAVVTRYPAIISLLAEILVDAHDATIFPPPPGGGVGRPADRAEAIRLSRTHIAGNLGQTRASIRRALAHNPAAAIMALNTAYAHLTAPDADSELLEAYFNALSPESLSAIDAAVAQGGLDGHTAVIIQAQRERDPIAFKKTIKNALAIANPASIAKVLNSDPIAEAILSQGAAQCREAVREARKDVAVDASAMSLVAASKNIASVQVNYAAAIAARRVAIGALTRVVTGGDAAAAIAVIETVDSDVWASLVVAGFNDDSKNTLAARIPVGDAPGAVALDEAAARLMLNNPESAKIALKAALNPPCTDAQMAAAREAIRAGIVAIEPEARRQALVRVALEAEPNPAAALTIVNTNHDVAVAAGISAEVNALSEQDVREIVKVDLAACALILNNAAVSDVRISMIAKWVPNPPAGGAGPAEQREAAILLLRGADAAAAAEALRAALSANPVEAQAAINAAIDGVLSRSLVDPLLQAVKNQIIQNPLAAIDAHPEVRAARDRFVATDHRVMAAQHALEVARRQAREGVPAVGRIPEEAVERDTEVIRARNALEAASTGANFAAFNADPGVQEAQGMVAEGAKQHIVQGKLRQQLAEGKPLTGDPINGAIRTVEFTPQDAQTPIIVSADEARDTAIQVLQDFERDLTTIAAAFDKQLKDAEACEAATEKSEIGENGIDRLGKVLEALAGIALRDSEQAMVTQAHEFLSKLKDPESLLGRLFDDSLVEQAKKEVEKATDDVTRLETELAAYRERTPARIRAEEDAGVVGAAEDALIPDELISRDVINGSTAMPERGSEIVRARAREYIAQVNMDAKIIAIRDAGDQPTADQIHAATRRVFQSDATMRAARELALSGLRAADGVPRVLAATGNDAAKALVVLEQIAAAQYTGVAIAEVDRARARELLHMINQQPNVRQALNERLDKQPNVQAVWNAFIDNDPQVKEKTEAVATAKEKVTTATANVAKIEDQVASAKQGVVALSKVLDEVETTQPKRAEEVKEALQTTKVDLDARAKAAEEASLNYRLPSNRT